MYQIRTTSELEHVLKKRRRKASKKKAEGEPGVRIIVMLLATTGIKMPRNPHGCV